MPDRVFDDHVTGFAAVLEENLDGVGDPSQPKARRALGVAPQSLAIYDDLSARENLDFFGRLYGITGKELKKRVGEVLDHVGLSSRGTDRVSGYSGGMKRRLNLAVAIIHRPAMLLLDEPTAGVDPQSRNNILDLVRDLAAGGTTIVYTTHYMEEAAKLCARVAIVDHGKVLATGTVGSLVAQFGGKSVVTVNRGEQSERFEADDPVSVVAKVMAEPGHGVDGLRIDRPDLESVFLNLTGRSLRD
jgi:ABC-2 type transport system ATP-binding protein